MDIHAIPIFGNILGSILTIFMAIPFWIGWTCYGIGAKFFYFLPRVYQTPGFWDSFWMFTCIGILLSFIPKIVSTSNTVNSSTK